MSDEKLETNPKILSKDKKLEIISMKIREIEEKYLKKDKVVKNDSITHLYQHSWQESMRDVYKYGDPNEF